MAPFSVRLKRLTLKKGEKEKDLKEINVSDFPFYRHTDNCKLITSDFYTFYMNGCCKFHKVNKSSKLKKKKLSSMKMFEKFQTKLEKMGRYVKYLGSFMQQWNFPT